MISFLSPLFLAGALAAAIPIVLHLLKREPEVRMKFAAVRLLRRAPVEHAQRRYLRELLLLALRVTALLLLAFAFARPFFTSGAALRSTGVTVIALDTSLSLSAPGQFDRAKALALDAVGRAATGEAIGVITFAGEAHVASAPSADRALAEAAIRSAAAGVGATRYRAALNAAAEMINAHGAESSSIVVVTDLQASGWDSGDRASVPEAARIEVADVGPSPPNLALTAVRASGERLVAVVRNAADKAREGRVRLTMDGRPAGETSVWVGAHQSAETAFAGVRGSAATVAVDDDEGVQADNVRYAVLDAGNRPAVLVITGTGDLGREAFYVQQGLTAAGAGGAAYDVEGAAGAALSAWDQARLDRYAAVVMLSTRGMERRARELLAGYVKAGGGVLLAAGDNIDGQVASDALGGATLLTVAPAAPERDARGAPRALAPADVRHPLFQRFGSGAAALGLVKFRHIATLGGTGCQTLARFTTGEAAIVDCAPGKGRALLIASDLNNEGNDFPRHATFVPFLHEALRYLSAGRMHTSEYLVGETPQGVPSAPGIVTLPAGAGGAPRQIAVNVDPRESDPARLSVEEFLTAVTRLQGATGVQERIEARQQEDRQHVWQYVLALMLAMMAVESLVAARSA